MKLSKLMMRGLPPMVGVGAVVLFLVQTRPPADATPATPPVVEARQAGGIRAEGHVVAYPGAMVTVGTEVKGTIAELRVEEKSVVKKGEVLALLSTTQQRAALSESRAQLSEARALLRQAAVDLEREKRLEEAGVVTAQALDLAHRDRDVAQARVEMGRARVKTLESVLDKARIVAPIDGVVISRMVHPGETVSEGTPLLTIADLSRVRVEAEVDEFDAGRVEVGTRVEVSAEGFDDQSWNGRVEDIPDAVVDRRLKPQDPGRPVDTRVLLVKVALAEPTPLKLNQRVDLSLTPKSDTPSTLGQARAESSGTAAR
ncbi:efflux RND transporter periplasmic adaptor subunit [Pyxidicoccus caerfyrddinensis]|uniref:efflux RND transporter periplasmic adaptor subunit n=1 Tax=Pyxidicoccus caerfyrddinensis TaxID=2709663 RepID=UPI0013DAB5A0|nr:efflux RND transporter periplasmic adaptor subunit [Pyxidicoccus caerfyrddinensis]